MAKTGRFLFVGALMLALAACHEPGHKWCDWNDDGDTDGACVALVVGAGAAIKLVALSALSQEQPDV